MESTALRVFMAGLLGKGLGDGEYLLQIEGANVHID